MRTATSIADAPAAASALQIRAAKTGDGAAASPGRRRSTPCVAHTAFSPIAFGGEHGLFGLYHPAADRTHPIGVVLCNPLGYEAMCAHRTYRDLAIRAAAKGFPVLRFDYEGTGDSAGGSDEPGRVSAWLRSIDHAIHELRRRAGVRSVALVGVRFGATLATLAASQRADVSALVLWAPCPSGRSYLRELRALRLLKNEPGATAKDGALADHSFHPTTLEELDAVNLRAVRTLPATRALLLHGHVAAADDSLGRQLAQLGVRVTVASKSGYESMMRDPQDVVVPVDTLDAVTAWLESGTSEGAPIVAPRPAAASPLHVSSDSGAPAQEHGVRFGSDGRLFGIVTIPPRISNSPAVLFLNVGAHHRVGPNRMCVSMARDTAALGRLAFRFDVAGLGDSATERDAMAGGRLYSKDSVSDVRAAMDFIERTHGVSTFVLVGLCSGAYLAFHTAAEDRRVVGQVLLNPQTFEFKEGDSLELSMRKSFLSTRYYLRAALSPEPWNRLIRGQVHVRAIAGALRDRFTVRAVRRLTSMRAKVAGQPAPQDDIERAFRGMSDRGVSSLLVFSFNDGGIDTIERHLGTNARRMTRRKNFRFEIVQGSDHTFSEVDAGRRLRALVGRWLKTSFA